MITIAIDVARTPPTNGVGIVDKIAPIFVNIPNKIKINPATSNVRRLATYKKIKIIILKCIFKLI